MGYPYNELIPPAVLLDHPGLTKEEFVEFLADTHSYQFGEFKPETPWEIVQPEWEDDKYKQGLGGLAGLLGLKRTSKFEEFQTPKKNEQGFTISPPWLYPVGKIKRQSLEEVSPEARDYEWEVQIHIRTVLGEPRLVDYGSNEKLEEGDVWRGCWYHHGEGIVTKLFKETHFLNQDPNDVQYQYVMELQPIEREYRSEFFRTDKELFEKWPQFHPEFEYDFSQESGFFAICFNEKHFAWIQKNGKYYLDKETTFNRIPASFGNGSLCFGYTDLILTSEAIKHKAWKLLSYRGKDHFEQFLEAFPSALEKYEQAIYQAHMSLWAKKNEMNVNEFLRMMLMGPNFDNRYKVQFTAPNED